MRRALVAGAKVQFGSCPRPEARLGVVHEQRAVEASAAAAAAAAKALVAASPTRTALAHAGVSAVTLNRAEISAAPAYGEAAHHGDRREPALDAASSDANAAALTWARRAEAAARDEAEEARHVAAAARAEASSASTSLETA